MAYGYNANHAMPAQYHKIKQFNERYCQKGEKVITVGDFSALKLPGRWLVTMNNHITCIIDGVIYDTFDPSNRYLWCCYKVK